MSETKQESIQQINIRKIFYDKNPRLAKILPGFVYRYLEKIAHQDFINAFLQKHGRKRDMDFVEAAITEFNVTLEVKGEENIPKSGRYIFVSNHPLGGFDGLVIMKIMSQYYKSFKFLVNDILMNITNLHGLFIPINKHGRQGNEAAIEIEQTFTSDAQILTFPAGYVSRYIKGQIVDLTWQKSFISKARQYQRDVIPIHMSGRNTNFFYRLGRFRKFIGLKANLEMLYLVDETYKHHNKHLIITFGKPIPWQTFDTSKRPLEWAKWVKEKVYKLDGVESIPL